MKQVKNSINSVSKQFPHWIYKNNDKFFLMSDLISQKVLQIDNKIDLA